MAAGPTSLDPKSQAALALHRFGFGPRAGSIAAIASDPRGALLAELERPGAGLISDGDLLSVGEAARAAFDFRQERKATRLAERAEKEAAKQPAAPPTEVKKPGMDAAPDMQAVPKPEAAKPEPAKPNAQPGVPQQIFLEEAKARFDAALGSEIGFAERLVWFWSNHFCVSADKARAIVGAYEREAIRPHVLGRFDEMLFAAESHPAMLVYLDNARSIGPNSQAGLRRGKGLNENLAREILELHTLGVNGGYSQQDVTSFAHVITGWTVRPPKNDSQGGEFTFNARMHEPGPQNVLGKAYPEGGLEQGRAVLGALAQNKATARFLAEKLARHFVSDTPPPALIDRLAKRFAETEGNLKEVAKALITSDEAWVSAREKLKRPGEWLIGVLRATGVNPSDIRPTLNAQNTLGEPLWRPPSPKGFADASAAWVDGLAERLDVANQMARRVAGLVEPEAALDTALGPLASTETRQAIARAESRPQALALLLMSPELQRR